MHADHSPQSPPQAVGDGSHAVLDLRAGGVLLHRLDAVQRRRRALIGLAGRNDLAVAGLKVKSNLPEAPFFSPNLPDHRAPSISDLQLPSSRTLPGTRPPGNAFAIFNLAGLQFSPRIRDSGRVQLYRLGLAHPLTHMPGHCSASRSRPASLPPAHGDAARA